MRLQCRVVIANNTVMPKMSIRERELLALLSLIHAVLPRECWFLRERIARALAAENREEKAE